MRAARWLGTPPWEMAERPSYWRDVALLAEAAEQAAEHRAAVEARRRERIERFAKGGKRGS